MDPQAFIGYSQAIHDIYGNLEDYNPTKNRKESIVFDYMIADVETNEKVSHIVLNCSQEEQKSILQLLLYHYFIQSA